MKFHEEEDVDRPYEEVRDLIADGDVFLFKGQYLLSKIFRRLDKSFYSHAGMAAWWGDRLMLLQAEPLQGIQAVPMSVAISTYRGRVDWYKLLRDSFEGYDVAECNRRLQQEVIFTAKALLGLPYAWADVLKNFCRRWIAKTVRLADKMWPKAMFCSQYVEECFQHGGMSLSHEGAITTFPKEIRDSEHLKYICTVPHDPNVAPARNRDEVVTRVRRRLEESIAESTHPHDASLGPPVGLNEVERRLQSGVQKP